MHAVVGEVKFEEIKETFYKTGKLFKKGMVKID